jgi:hypothetical protein
LKSCAGSISAASMRNSGPLSRPDELPPTLVWPAAVRWERCAGPDIGGTLWPMRPLSNSRILRRAAVGVFVLLSCVLCVPTDSGLSAPASVAVVFERGGDLYATSVDGSRTIRLTKTRVREWEPAVSPDGKRIAFSRGGSGISTMKVNGSRPTIWTRGSVSAPAWAPDGRSIYFVRARAIRGGATCGSIFRVSPGAPNTRRITNAPRVAIRTWTPPYPQTGSGLHSAIGTHAKVERRARGFASSTSTGGRLATSRSSDTTATTQTPSIRPPPGRPTENAWPSAKMPTSTSRIATAQMSSAWCVAETT